LFEGSQLEEVEEARGRKKKQASKEKRTSYREYEEDA
jgi:hypothetical protein